MLRCEDFSGGGERCTGLEGDRERYVGRRAKVFNFFALLECAFDTIVRYDDDDGDGGVVCKTMNGLQAHIDICGLDQWRLEKSTVYRDSERE